MNTYGNHLPACSSGCLCFCNSSKSKTMINLIARKNLFRLSEYFFSLAVWWERAGVMTLQKLFFLGWRKCLDTRDKLRWHNSLKINDLRRRAPPRGASAWKSATYVEPHSGSVPTPKTFFCQQKYFLKMQKNPLHPRNTLLFFTHASEHHHRRLQHANPKRRVCLWIWGLARRAGNEILAGNRRSRKLIRWHSQL